MNEIETFVKADQTLASVVDQIPDDRWDEQVPSDFPTFDDRPYTFRQILDYQAYDEAWIPDMLAGRSIDDVGSDSYGDPHGSDLLGDSPAQRFRDLTDKAIDAVEALDEADLDDRIVHYSYGDYPAREALWHTIVFRSTRAYDLAKAIGIDPTLPEDLISADVAHRGTQRRRVARDRRVWTCRRRPRYRTVAGPTARAHRPTTLTQACSHIGDPRRFPEAASLVTRAPRRSPPRRPMATANPSSPQPGQQPTCGRVYIPWR